MTLSSYVARTCEIKLAKQLKVSRQTIYNWKKETHFPSPKHLRKILKLSKNSISKTSLIEAYLKIK